MMIGRTWIEPVRTSLLLKIRNLVVEHVHLARLAGTQLVADIEPIAAIIWSAKFCCGGGHKSRLGLSGSGSLSSRASSGVA
jgi:hypothetical protein